MVFWLVATVSLFMLFQLRQTSRRNAWMLAWDSAYARHDWPTLEKMIRQAERYVRHPRDRVRLQSTLSWILGAQDRHDEAAAALDPALASDLPPRELADWMISRGYYLAKGDHFDEALAELEHAELLLSGNDDIDAKLAATCVVGNRGLIALRQGALDEAWRLIERAHRTTARLLESLPPDHLLLEATREWHAERFLWLSEIAERRGDHDLARKLLFEAASLEGTRWGARARKQMTEKHAN